MRYSSDKNDPGYEAWHAAFSAGKRIAVFLDGVEQEYCDIANDEAGYVRRCKLNEAGEIYAIGNVIADEEVYGEVGFVVSDYDGQ